MAKLISLKKQILLLTLLFLVFLSINSNWLWKLMYPIKYEQEVAAHTERYQVDPYLVLSIIQVETKFEENKVSKKGALGLMQLMPATAEWIVDHGEFPKEMLTYVTEPEVNIALGSWYLSQMDHQFQGNMLAVIAAYNAGPGNVAKWLKEDIWNGTVEEIEHIPFGETRHYIQRVLYFYERYQWIYDKQF